MPKTLNQAEGSASMADLESTFRRFRRRTAALRSTYVELRDEAERMNEELKHANRRLEDKVQELEQVNSFQNSIMASLPVGVTVTDLRGVVQRFNPAAEDIWGIEAAEAIGRPVEQVMGDKGEVLKRVLAGDVQCRTLQRKVRGGERVLSTTANMVRDNQGAAIGAIQVDRDISRIHRLEDQLTQSENMADLGRSAAGMAHEVRKPLNGIKGFASLLRRVTEGESADKYSSRIMEAAGRLDSMLEDLLDFARPDNAVSQTMDLRHVTEKVVAFVNVENEPDMPDVELNVQIEDDAKRVIGDARKMEQVLLNLVKNAVEAIDTAGEVVIEARRVQEGDDPQVEVSVTDDGKGIPVERQKDVLEPFSTNKEGGTGLGLAMVQKILRLHGTEIDIDSEPGAGTSMTFHLSAIEKGNEND